MADFKVTRYRIRIEEGQHGPETPFSAVFLSDLHNASYGEDNSRLLQEIRGANPEAVFVSGDMITASKEPQMDVALALMSELTKQFPVYYVNGNHETRLKESEDEAENYYESFAVAIRACGVHLLENFSEQIEIHRMRMNISGLELPGDYYNRLRKHELTKEKIEELIGRSDGSAYQILLAHHPSYFEVYAAWGADLTLSGHLHGGIIRLPFLGGIVSPQIALFPKYDRGLYTKNEKKLIVSAGLGNHTVNLRINNPPELIVLDFI
ncbi:MAG: metallophosphoesterase [Lachnospiraceae bacterium]|nr:metallophosphoesterase [Lachnospiraceae bacterium]